MGAWQSPHDKIETIRKRSNCTEKHSDSKDDAQADHSVQCLSKPPNKTQQKPHVASPRKIRKKDSAGPTMPTSEEELQKTMEKFGGDTQRLMRSYHEIERERDELKKKCYAYEALTLKLKKDLENARVGKKRKKDREWGSDARAKRLRFGDSHSPIQIE